MKEGWTYKKLGEVCEKITDGSHNPPKGVVKSENIMLSSQNVQNDYLDMSNARYISDEDFRKEDQRTSASKGDVLLTIVGTIGRTCVLKGTEGNITFQRSVAVLKPSNNILSRFLMFLLLSQNSVLNTTAQGAAQKGIYLKQLGNLGLFYPPLSEQQSIVDYLDSAFAKIDAMKANAEKALNEAKALLQASLKEMLKPKEGWEEKTLGDVCEIKSILVDPTEVPYKKLLHVGGANIVSETGELKDLKTAAEEKLTSGKFIFNEEDVLYNKIRPYLMKVSKPFFSGLCSADMYPLKSKKGMTRDYLYYILISRDFTDYAIMNSARAGMPKLNRQALFAYKCMIPPIPDQQSIVTTLDSLKSKVDCLQKNFDKISQECDALKQALLRHVFDEE